MIRFALIFAVLLPACQTSPKEGEDQSIQFEFNKNFSGNLPPSLWSPSRRRMNAHYYYIAGEYLYLENKMKEAEKLFSASYNLEPNPFVGRKMVGVMAINGEVSDALMNAKKLSLLYPKDANIRSLLGSLLLQRQDLDRAEKEFQKATQLASEEPHGYIGLIGVYRLRNEKAKALTIARQLVEKNPSLAEGWATLAKMHLVDRDRQKALETSKRAYELRSQDPEKILIYALALEINGQSQKAVGLYEQLFRLNPTSEELIQRMVGLYRQIGDLNDALSLLEDAEKKNPSDGVLLQKAFIYWELKKFHKSSQILDSLAKRHPGRDRFLYLAGLGRERIKDVKGALYYFLNIDEESSLFVHARFRAINLYRYDKNLDAAYGVVREVLDSEAPRRDEFYSIGGQILKEKNDIPKAISLLEEGVDQFPERLGILFLLGAYYEQNNQMDECVEVMKRVIEKDPKHHAALNFLGYLYVEMDENLDEAEEMIRQAIELKPGDGFYLDSLGWLYFRKGDLQKAEKWLLAAYQLVPDEGVVMEHLGDLYFELERPKDALEWYQKALKGRLEPRDKERIEEKIKERTFEES